MTHYQVQNHPVADDSDAISALVRLRGALALVERMAEGANSLPDKPLVLDHQALDDGATLTLAYANASSVARRRFDALASEAAGFAAAGLKALIQYKQRTGRECAPAARELADEMSRSIAAMSRIITAGGF
jgi:uncharacterized tellurite resistance protein B-like protein